MNEILETQTDPAIQPELAGFTPRFEEISHPWREPAPQPPKRLHQFFERQCDATPDAPALVAGPERSSYAALDARANRLAHYLLGLGAGPGRTAGILLERSGYTYLALLGVLKTGSAFVPIDPSYPADRVAFIAADAGLSVLLTTSKLAAANPDLPCAVVALDEVDPLLGALRGTCPAVPDDGDDLAYIIYTSGTTGRPKGVAVNHSNICHFLSVCTPIYGVSAQDRVYQGMTIAFDFSIEEIWPAWMAGATLVAGPTDTRRLGPGLAEFLIEQQITVLCSVPTLLATLEGDVPSLRTLIVGGEACPRDLVERWSRPGRRMLNTYGPTETTVTATWSELVPGKPVTIGRPMPGYRVYVLDDKLRPVRPGEPGEICIGGAGVACGYVNRPELTAAKFVPDPFGGDGPDARLYRSGDLGRSAKNGEIEFLGRIDSQVKIRGYRIELSEIEAVLLEDSAVENAVVATVPAGGPPQDLAAYLTLRNAAPVAPLRERLAQELRRRLPAYMVPGFIEVLDRMPTLASGKTNRNQLPPPASPRLGASSGAYEPPATPLEEKLAAAWRATFGRDDVSVKDDFFLDLGGHSLFAAQLISKLRNDPELRRLSIADLYAHPNIRSLARHVEEGGSPEAQAKREPAAPVRRHTSRRVWTAGAGQAGLLYAWLALLGAPVALLISVHAHEHSPFGFTGLDLILPAVLLLVSIVLPVALKWVLIGRFRSGRYPLWGWYYCRWWLVRKALDLSPLTYLAGSPLFLVYARLLGARVGRGCHIATGHLHLPDLVEIGDGASIGYEVDLQPFLVEDGWLELAPIRIGADAFVGTKSVILAGAEVGRGARIAEQTLVTRGQAVPDGESWAGSPAQRASKDPLLETMEAQPAPRSTVSAWLWAGFAAGFALLEMLPLLIAMPGLLLIAYADELGGPAWALAATPLAGLSFVLTTCALVAAGKRLVMPHARPGIYPLHSAFGLRKWFSDKLMATSLTVTNTLYATLYTLPWLRALGARIGPRSEVSTVSQIDPDLLVLGTETFVADIASIGAATFHNGYVALGWTRVGDRTFLGNASVIRSQTQLPDNCLIGVQSVAPAEPVRPGTSWLGSPAIFLPRRQASEAFADSLTYRPPASLVAYRLAVEFVRVVLPPALLYFLGALATAAAFRLLARTSVAVLVAAMPGLYLAGAALVTLLVAGLKWTVVGRYRPRVEPLWAPFVRHTELITGLYETTVVPALAWMLTGTPWIAPLLRAFGVRIGRRVYLETTFVTEFDLVRVGDDTAIGRATSLQSHLFEDRVMKMSTLTVGAGCSIGPRAVVLYDSAIGAGASLDALSLVMKGETLPAATRWCGIPARLAQ